MICDYAIRRRGRSLKTNVTPDNKLKYPTHPFPPALSKLLSALPERFSDMALRSLLSYPVIPAPVPHDQEHPEKSHGFPGDTSIAVEMMRLSMERNARALEKASDSELRICKILVRHVDRGTTASEQMYRSVREPQKALAKSIFGFAKTAG